jgi:hypothetical protein
MKKLFIFDVDDVIYDLKHTINRALTSETGKDIHPDDWHSFNLNTVYDVDIQVIFDAFHKHDILNTGELNFDVYKVIDYLNQAGVETLALTARGWHPKGNEITQAFFENNNIEIGNIKVVQHHESKSDYIASLTGYDIIGYVDDNSKHIHQTKQLLGGDIKKYFLKNQPWNSSYDIQELGNIDRISSLLEINTHLEHILTNSNKKTNKNLL